MLKRVCIYLVLIILGVSLVNGETSKTTYLVPIEGEINSAVSVYVKKAIEEAINSGAEAIIFEINTNGGLVASAQEISNHIINAGIPTISYIKDNALSAGVIIAISADTVVANKAINIGSAETRPNEEKYISAWAGRLRTVAKQKGRNPEIIAGMADADIEIEGIKEQGKLLNLTADEALEYGIADELVDGRKGLYDYLQLKASDVIELHYDFKTNIARFTNNPYVSTLLIAAGIIGIIGELFTAGFGVLGAMGILSFALFFAGKVLAGHTGWGILILFIAGVLLIGIEISLPGFGVPGVAGGSCVVLSILLSSNNLIYSSISLFLAIVISIVILIVLLKYLPRNQFFSHIVLKNTQNHKELKNDSTNKRKSLVGLEGEVISLLRPSGTVLIGDEKVDVISEGEYIEKGTKVKVVAVEGNKVVVRKMSH